MATKKVATKAKEEVTSNKTTEAKSGPKEAIVFDRNMREMRVFTAEDGKDFVKQAEALAGQDRRDGWTVLVR